MTFAYGVYVSASTLSGSLLRMSGLCYRARLLTNGLFSRGYLGVRLVSAVEGLCERRRDLIGSCSVAVSGLVSDSLASDEA